MQLLDGSPRPAKGVSFQSQCGSMTRSTKTPFEALRLNVQPSWHHRQDLSAPDIFAFMHKPKTPLWVPIKLLQLFHARKDLQTFVKDVKPVGSPSLVLCPGSPTHEGSHPKG